MKTRRILSLLLALALVFAALGAGQGPARAEASPESDLEINEESGAITGYHRAGGDVVIPPTIGGVAVIAIEDNVFNGNDDITSVTIPYGVTSIGENAFFSARTSPR